MHEVRVVRNEPAATGLRLLTLDRALPDHTRPGQYVLVYVGPHEPAFFALASSPGEPVCLLVKADVGTAAEDLVRVRPGEALLLSEVLGDGFPVERVAGLELVALVNGSGISAIRPLLDAEVAAGLKRPVHLYLGVQTVGHRAFPWALEEWANAGVKVHTVVDRDGAEGWYGRTGYVQHAAEADGLLRPGVALVLSGLPVMLEQARALWEAVGVPPEHILTNF